MSAPPVYYSTTDPDKARQWNERVSVCRQHVDQIVDGDCVICEIESLRAQLAAAEAERDRAVEAERERCAAICDLHSADYTRAGAEVCAKEIRAAIASATGEAASG